MSDYFKQELSDFKNSSKKLREDLLNYFRGIQFGPSTLYDPSKWDSLVHYWPLNGGANDVVGSADLTTEGSPSYVPGVDQQGVSFNGSDQGASNQSLSIDPGVNGHTVSCWVNIASSTNQLNPIAGVATGSSLNGILIGTSSQNILANITTDIDTYTVELIAESEWSTGTLYHFAMAYDPSSSELIGYVNGSSVNTINTSGDPVTYSQVILGGSSAAGLFADLNLLDEVRVDNTALSASEIETLYQAGA